MVKIAKIRKKQAFLYIKSTRGVALTLQQATPLAAAGMPLLLGLTNPSLFIIYRYPIFLSVDRFKRLLLPELSRRERFRVLSALHIQCETSLLKRWAKTQH